VPANMFAVTALGSVQELSRDLWQDSDLQAKAAELQADIQRGIEEHAVQCTAKSTPVKSMDSETTC